MSVREWELELIEKVILRLLVRLLCVCVCFLFIYKIKAVADVSSGIKYIFDFLTTQT